MDPAIESVLKDINEQKSVMVAVATGGPQIKTKEAEYAARQIRIRHALAELGIKDPNPFDDLWGWYGHWSSGELPTWASRRKYIAELYGPTIRALNSRTAGRIEPVAEPTGWARVDRGLDKIRLALEVAKNEEDFQGVGLLCRETLISAAQEVFDSFLHVPSGVDEPSHTDAYRMLELFIGYELQGASNEVLRHYAKSTIKLANQLVHQRTASARDALLSAAATRTVVNLVAILARKTT